MTYLIAVWRVWLQQGTDAERELAELQAQLARLQAAGPAALTVLAWKAEQPWADCLRAARAGKR